MAAVRPIPLVATLVAPFLAFGSGCVTGGTDAHAAAGAPLPEWNPALHDNVDATPATLGDLAGTHWLAEDIDRGGVLDRAQSRRRFLADGAVDGHGGCNAFQGGATPTATGFRFGPLAATRKACPAALMDQERRFLDALGRVRGATTSHGLLFLRDADGVAILRFSRLPDAPTDPDAP